MVPTPCHMLIRPHQNQRRLIDREKLRFADANDREGDAGDVSGFDEAGGVGVAKGDYGEPGAEQVIERRTVVQEGAGQARARGGSRMIVDKRRADLDRLLRHNGGLVVGVTEFYAAAFVFGISQFAYRRRGRKPGCGPDFGRILEQAAIEGCDLAAYDVVSG